MGIWPPSPGRPHRLGPGGAGIDCCTGIEIGYFANEINVGDALGLTVENADPACKGKNYSWAIAEGPGSLSSESGLDVIYTAPTSGHDCPGNTTITLSCGGEIMDTLVVTINYGYTIEYVSPDPEVRIERESSMGISVVANNTPLLWSVSGTGFSLDSAQTDGVNNTLLADASACGCAEITVTGCDSQNVTFYIRATTGQWVLKECFAEGDHACVGPGWTSRDDFDFYQVKGKTKVYEAIFLGTSVGYTPAPVCPGACLGCGGSPDRCDICLVTDCNVLTNGTWPLGSPPCCYQHHPGNDTPYRYYTQCYKVAWRDLFEWEC